MKNIFIILQQDIKEKSRSFPFFIIALLTAFLTMAAIATTSILIQRLPWLLLEIKRPLLLLILGLFIYFLPFIVHLSFLWAFMTLPIIKEKKNGNILNLLATTVKPWELILGKGLAIFLLAYSFSVVSIGVFLLVNHVLLNHFIGSFLYPVPLLLTSLFLSPLFFLIMLLFMLYLSLTKDPDLATAPSFILGFGLMLGIPLGIQAGIIDLASWSFLQGYAIADFLSMLFLLFLLKKITKEKIVLSSAQS